MSVSCCLWGPAPWSVTFDLDPLWRSNRQKSCGMPIVTLTFDLDLLSRSFKVKDPILAGLGSLWLLFLKVLTLATDVIDFHEHSPGLRVFGSVRAASRRKSVLLRVRRQVSCFCAFRFRRSYAITSFLSPSHCRSWKGQSSELVSIVLKAIEMSILMHIMFQGYPE